MIKINNFCVFFACSLLYSSFEWVPQVSNTKNSLNHIIWAKTKFVAVGDSGTVISSSDGVFWNQTNVPTDENLVSVAYSENQFVIIGESGMYTSSTGVSWEVIPSLNNGWWKNSVAYGNGKYVAVGQYVGMEGFSQVITSIDGEVWEPRSFRFIRSLNYIGYLSNSVDLSQFYVVSNNSVAEPFIFNSEDGVNWVNDSISIDEDPQDYRRILNCIGGHKIMVVGDRGRIMYYDNNTNVWKNILTDFNNELFSISGVDNISVVVGVDGIVVTIKDNYEIEKVNYISSKSLNSVVYGKKFFVIIGDDGVLYRSKYEITSIFTPNYPVKTGGMTQKNNHSANGRVYFEKNKYLKFLDKKEK